MIFKSSISHYYSYTEYKVALGLLRNNIGIVQMKIEIKWKSPTVWCNERNQVWHKIFLWVFLILSWSWPPLLWIGPRQMCEHILLSLNCRTLWTPNKFYQTQSTHQKKSPKTGARETLATWTDSVEEAETLDDQSKFACGVRGILMFFLR